MVYVLKLIWYLFTEPCSLWIACVKHNLLRGETLWDVRQDIAGFWVWRKLLQLRHVAQQFLKMDIKNCNSLRFWTYIWHPIGRLTD